MRTLNNPKVQQLPASDFKGWVNLLCLAKEFDGILPPIDDISFRLRLSKRKAEILLKSLRFNGLIDGDRMHDWDEMQYSSDTSTERVKRYRERQRNVSGNVPSDVPTVSGSVPVTVQSRVDKSETVTDSRKQKAETDSREQNQWSSSPQGLNVSGAEPEKDGSTHEPPFIELPLAKKGSVAEITVEQIITWTQSYPGVDVQQQLRNMREWLLHNPTKRKTSRGIGRFITSWLAKEQNRGTGHNGQRTTAGADDAWAKAIAAHVYDNKSTVFITKAIFKAFPFALYEVDKIGARMAFKEAYPASLEKYGTEIYVHLGTDPRPAAYQIHEARRAGTISQAAADALITQLGEKNEVSPLR